MSNEISATGTVYILAKETKPKNGMHLKEYVVWVNGNPIDRFTIFYASGTWNAWTGDTMSEVAKNRRHSFAELQN